MKVIRIFALMLSILLMFSLLGCEKIDLSGGKNPGENGGEGGSSAPDLSDSHTLTVKTTVSGRETFRPEEGLSPKTNQILAQIQEVEDATGCKVDVEILSKESLSTAFLRACRAGKKYADMIQTDGAFLSRYYSEGYFMSLAEAGLEPSATGSLTTADGIAYGLRADGWNNPNPTLSYLLFYNEKILTESGCQTPLQLAEEGVWNWVNFKTLCQQVTQRNPGEVYAIAYPNDSETDLIWATLHAAGLTYFAKDGTCTMDSPEGLEGFSQLRGLLTSGVTYSLGSYENSTAEATAKLAFLNGRTAFLVGNSKLLFETDENSLFSGLKEDLRIIGFPAIKEGTPGASFSEPDVFCAITSTANRELCQQVVPRLFAPREGTDPNQELIDTYFYHQQDGEIYLDLLSASDTETALGMGENRSLVEEYFVRVAKGASAKEILSNFQTIFNSQTKG